MKASHFVTPRSLAECEFTTGYASMNSETKSYRVLGYSIIVSGLIVAVCVGTGLVLAGVFGG